MGNPVQEIMEGPHTWDYSADRDMWILRELVPPYRQAMIPREMALELRQKEIKPMCTPLLGPPRWVSLYDGGIQDFRQSARLARVATSPSLETVNRVISRMEWNLALAETFPRWLCSLFGVWVRMDEDRRWLEQWRKTYGYAKD